LYRNLYLREYHFVEVLNMTKKLFVLLVAVCVMLSGMAVAFAEDVTTPTDTPVEPVINFSLTFAANIEGAIGVMETVVLDAAGEVTVPALGYTHEIFDFTGWNTNIDGSGIAYAEGDKVAVDGNFVLYAQWIRKGVTLEEFTVTYDANGGEGETIDDMTYIEGLDAMVLENGFTRAGYDFVEWNTEADGSGISYQPYDFITMTDSITLYAIWEDNGLSAENEEEHAGDDTDEDYDDYEDFEEDEIVTDSDADTEIPKTGDASAVVVAAGVCAVASAAYVALRKKN
jgi:uncharacterized repeat protein (TIGR02543 family)/LPXTG-motif cell wall-anchored protein